MSDLKSPLNFKVLLSVSSSTFPDIDNNWEDYVENRAGGLIYNTLYVDEMSSIVSHELGAQGKALLQKGVFKISSREFDLDPNAWKEDKEYIFVYDFNKPIDEQDISTEAKIMLAKIYKDYLCSDEEREKWKEFELFRLTKIEQHKKQKYKGKYLKFKK